MAPISVCEASGVSEWKVVDKRTYYDALHPSLPVVWVLSASREFEDPVDVGDKALTEISAENMQHAVGMRNRMLYLQLLECLFAHVFANAQFPIAPQAWLARYRPMDLRELAGHLRRVPWSVPDVVPAIRHSDALVSWLFGVELLGALSEEQRKAEVRAVQRLLALLATDYSSESLDREYNSIKHGLRAMPAPWSLTLSPEGMPGIGATFGASYGSHFLVDARGPSPAGHYFTLRERSQSWHPERDLKLAQLASWLLHNLVSAQKSPDPSRRFYVFRGIDLDQLTVLAQPIGSFELGALLDLPNPIRSRVEVKTEAVEIAQHAADWIVARAREVAASRDKGPADGDLQ